MQGDDNCGERRSPLRSVGVSRPPVEMLLGEDSNRGTLIRTVGGFRLGHTASTE